MRSLILPPLEGDKPVPKLPDGRQLTIIGGSGAGKTKFMEKLMALTGERTYCLSAVKAPFPEREASPLKGSIDYLYSKVASRRPYMRTNAVSELEKLIFMLFADEFDQLLQYKDKCTSKSNVLKFPPTKLDKLKKIWERIYPGNKILSSGGTLMFSTESGKDLIPAEKLSQGEMAVLYYVAGVLYAMPNAIIFIDAPSLFLHPTILNALWNSIESLRPDCTFVYNSVDVEFVSSRSRNVIIWVKSYDASKEIWNYEVIAPGEIREEIFIELVGSRKPVLFIEGDLTHSIDAKLYPLVFPDYTVKPLGSCDKVIETTRSFNGLTNMHHLESRGIVDRDRRTDREVEYLRKKSIMVPEVAEVENLFLLEPVVRTMARSRGKNADIVMRKVKKRAFGEFHRHLQQQVMEHVRHRVKREVDAKIDAKFSCITALEAHLRQLIKILNPRKQYNDLLHLFRNIIDTEDYASLLRYFNHKPLISECELPGLLGFKNKDDYVRGVISKLKSGDKESEKIRDAIRNALVPVVITKEENHKTI
ncbi:MAG: DUF4435 domain-containing protein [Muribaculaceae bacterium]|nr:DUF4435 domain-containing protein [Muribaculaceae bacterium]